ncbi:hypothetical protein EMIT0P253_90065 [Pseudomonas sp. IT-P253]
MKKTPVDPGFFVGAYKVIFKRAVYLPAALVFSCLKIAKQVLHPVLKFPRILNGLFIQSPALRP